MMIKLSDENNMAFISSGPAPISEIGKQLYTQKNYPVKIVNNNKISEEEWEQNMLQ